MEREFGVSVVKTGFMKYSLKILVHSEKLKLVTGIAVYEDLKSAHSEFRQGNYEAGVMDIGGSLGEVGGIALGVPEMAAGVLGVPETGGMSLAGGFAADAGTVISMRSSGRVITKELYEGTRNIYSYFFGASREYNTFDLDNKNCIFRPHLNTHSGFI